VDVYTGNFTGFLLNFRNASVTGAVTGQYLPSGLSYAIAFTVSSPTDIWTYTGLIGMDYPFGRGGWIHQDPRDPDYYDAGYWDAIVKR